MRPDESDKLPDSARMCEIRHSFNHHLFHLAVTRRSLEASIVDFCVQFRPGAESSTVRSKHDFREGMLCPLSSFAVLNFGMVREVVWKGQHNNRL